MTKNDNEILKMINEKLSYIGLDLNSVPDFLKQENKVDFKPLKSYEDNANKVYKYVDLDKIQILITPTEKMADLKEKYEKSAYINEYLNPESEEEIARHILFLEMVDKLSLKTVIDAEDQQKMLNKNIPFRVRFKENFLWQIYYSEFDDKYFMLVPTQEFNYGPLFYVLKEQIKYFTNIDKSKKQIFVPVNCVNYTNTKLKLSDIRDLEKYMWTFAKNYPQVYEVYNKDGKSELIIVGETFVYKDIKSNYRMSLKHGDEEINFFKLLKAAYILQTELKNHFKFEMRIDKKNELVLMYKDKELTFEKLPKLLKEEYDLALKTIEKDKKELSIKTREYELLTNKYYANEKSYKKTELEIAAYLESKKTFFGKVKYFFKIKSKSNKKVIIEYNANRKSKGVEKIVNKVTISKEKVVATIEDIILIYKDLIKQSEKIENMKLDIKALEFKNVNMGSKLKNAKLYLEEINSHKKSIFEFWKFTNKDELKQIEAGLVREEGVRTTEITKVFNLENDLQKLGKQKDKEQRETLKTEEKDAIYLTTTKLLNCFNMIKEDTDDVTKKIENNDEMKVVLSNILRDKKNIDTEEIDVFGKLYQDKTKLNLVGNKRHREVEKNLYKILDIRKNISIFDFKEMLVENLKIIEQASEKIKSNYDMSIYLLANEKINIENSLNKCTIKIDDCIDKQINSNAKKDEYILYRFNIKENMPLMYYTNIIFFENFNKTLPIGMNIVDEVLMNGSLYKFNLIKEDIIYKNTYINAKLDSDKLESKKIKVYEYDLSLKSEKDYIDEKKEKETIKKEVKEKEKNIKVKTLIEEKQANKELSKETTDKLKKNINRAKVKTEIKLKPKK